MEKDFFFSAKWEACEEKISAGSTPLCPAFQQLCKGVILEQWQLSCDHEATSTKKNKKAKIQMMEEVKGKTLGFEDTVTRPDKPRKLLPPVFRSVRWKVRRLLKPFLLVASINYNKCVLIETTCPAPCF